MASVETGNRFASRTVEPVGAGVFRITGDLTIVGTTRPITPKATTHRKGADRVRVTARGSVQRLRHRPASLLEAGVGDRVTLALDISARSA